MREALQGIQNNQVLLSAMLAWLIAQVAKSVLAIFTEKRINFRRFVEPGGMPSAHSAFVTALGTAIGLSEGWETPVFALATVFALIVMYDAAGVRRAAGRQARILNMIVEDLNNPEQIPERLKELIGHTPTEVFVGALLGMVVAVWQLAG